MGLTRATKEILRSYCSALTTRPTMMEHVLVYVGSPRRDAGSPRRAFVLGDLSAAHVVAVLGGSPGGARQRHLRRLVVGGCRAGDRRVLRAHGDRHRRLP